MVEREKIFHFSFEIFHFPFREKTAFGAATSVLKWKMANGKWQMENCIG
jgi:hypothetical protein